MIANRNRARRNVGPHKYISAISNQKASTLATGGLAGRLPSERRWAAGRRSAASTRWWFVFHGPIRRHQAPCRTSRGRSRPRPPTLATGGSPDVYRTSVSWLPGGSRKHPRDHYVSSVSPYGDIELRVGSRGEGHVRGHTDIGHGWLAGRLPHERELAAGRLSEASARSLCILREPIRGRRAPSITVCPP